MKIGLVVPANLKYAPYVQYYIKVFNENAIDYEVMVWNKSSIEENADYVLNYSCIDSDRKRIFVGHFLFAYKCKKFIQKKQIDHLIVFTIAPLFFLGKHFLKRYKNNLIIDIRDDSPFRRKFARRLKQICGYAKYVVVSSNKYTPWTGRDTILCHNADDELLKKNIDLPVKKIAKTPYSIVFAGSMNEVDINLMIIRKLKNSTMFSFEFVGKLNAPKKKLMREVAENEYKNVSFEGTYKKEEIVKKYREKADLINIFRKNTIVNRNALPNKLYDAVSSAIPVVVFRHNEAIASYVMKYHLGIILEDSDLSSLENTLLKKVQEFDYYLYQTGRISFINEVLKDQKYFEKLVLDFSKSVHFVYSAQ